MSETRYVAGSCHYPGEIDSMLGEVVGPTTYGSWVIAARQTYDAELDRTTVVFVHATKGDLAEAAVS